MTLFENLNTFAETNSEARELTKNEIAALRKEIVLGSLYTRDYENSLDLDPHEVQDFFDGFIDYIQNEFPTDEFELHDNIDEIYEYYAYMFDVAPLTISDDENEYLNESRPLSPSEFKKINDALNKHNPMKKLVTFYVLKANNYQNGYANDYILNLELYVAIKPHESSYAKNLNIKSDRFGLGRAIGEIYINLLDNDVEIRLSSVMDRSIRNYIASFKADGGELYSDIDVDKLVDNIKTAAEQSKSDLMNLMNSKNFIYGLTGKAKNHPAADYSNPIEEKLANLKEDFDPSMPNWLMRAIRMHNAAQSIGHKDLGSRVSLDTAKWTVDTLPNKGTFSKVTANKIYALLINASGKDSTNKRYIVYSPALNLGRADTIYVNGRDRSIYSMSLKALEPYVVEYAYIPDADIEYAKVDDKRKDRAANKSIDDRNPDVNYWSFGNRYVDKSGYIVDPDKYKTILASIKTDDYVQRLNDLYTVLSSLYEDLINSAKTLLPSPDTTRNQSLYGNDMPTKFKNAYNNYSIALAAYQEALKSVEHIKNRSVDNWRATPAFERFDELVSKSENYIAHAYASIGDTKN